MRRPAKDGRDWQHKWHKPRDRQNSQGIVDGVNPVVLSTLDDLEIPVYTDCTQSKERRRAQQDCQETIQFTDVFSKNPLAAVDNGGQHKYQIRWGENIRNREIYEEITSSYALRATLLLPQDNHNKSISDHSQ